MKKFITIFLCTTCISVSAIAQSGVRIGNMEFTVRKNSEQDTMVQIVLRNTNPPSPSENKTSTEPSPTKSANKFKKYNSSRFYWGIGFIIPDNFIKPDNRSDYYTILGGQSYNFDMGWMRRYHISRRFAVGGTLHYSFYNYKLWNVANEPTLSEDLLNISFDNNEIRKQVFRSRNIVTGVFTRFYLSPPHGHNKGGLFVDLGAQGDFAFSKFYKIKTHTGVKSKQRDGYAFNPFTASAIARVGRGSVAVFARYRFTESLNPRALPLDLPPITIGIQLFQ
jgi:hypothetical protein